MAPIIFFNFFSLHENNVINICFFCSILERSIHSEYYNKYNKMFFSHRFRTQYYLQFYIPLYKLYYIDAHNIIIYDENTFSFLHDFRRF